MVVPSALIGAIIGGTRMPTWQVAVESAQVLAGIVAYPPDNPFYLYHVSTWTLLHQLCALLLKVGLSEFVISLLLSASLTALMFAALSLVAFAVCREVFVSIASPLVLFSVFGGSDIFGLVYPIYLTGTHHTYGVAGLGLSVLILALTALGRMRTAAFLLGLAFSIHITWAAWTSLVLGVQLVCFRRYFRADLSQFRNILIFGAMGATLSAISFAVHQLWAPPAGPTSAKTAALVDAFIDNWDAHRQSPRILQTGTFFALATLGLSLAALGIFSRSRRDANRELDDPSTSEQRISALSASAAVLSLLAIVPMFYLDPAWSHARVPRVVELAMPGRFINLAIVLCPSLIAACAVRILREARVVLALMLGYGLFAGLFRLYLSSDRFGWDLPHAHLFAAAGFALCLWPIRGGALSYARRWKLASACAIAAFAVYVLLVQRAYPRESGISLRAQSPALEHLRGGEGMLITPGGTELIQLRTRRPIVLNAAALDQIPYVPASAPAIEEILDEVYGIALADPPERIRKARPGGLPPNFEHAAWERHTASRWARIAEKFGATHVLTDIELDAKLEFEKDTWRIYSIADTNLSNNSPTP